MWNTEKFKLLEHSVRIRGQRAPEHVIFDLTSVDGNVFMLMGTFKKLARRQGWLQENIKAVLDECITGDYDHAVQTLLAVTTTEDELDDNDYADGKDPDEAMYGEDEDYSDGINPYNHL